MTIRTPEDEVDKLDWYYPPFKAGDWYQGATYGGHSDFSVDWNRRTKNGGWLEDLGQPVLAAAAGTVAELEPAGGAVFVNHWGGLRRTEYRHMRVISVKVGDKVQRGDKLGEIGAVGISPSSGFVPSPHLHHVHWKRARTSDPWQRTRQSFYGEPVAASVGDSDSRPKTWDAPGPVMVQGPPTRATWESAAREAIKALDKAEDKVAGLSGQLGAAQEAERLARTAAEELSAANQALKVRIAALENATPVNCDAAVAAERDRVKAAAVAAVEGVS